MPLSNNTPEIIDIFWSPFSVCFAPLVRRYQWNPAESLVHVFVTFLVLSHSKLLFAPFNLLVFTQLFNSTGAMLGRVLYYDASVAFFSQEHIPFAFPTIFVFNILPLLVVVLYPTWVFRSVSTAAESGGMQSMHLLMPLFELNIIPSKLVGS